MAFKSTLATRHREDTMTLLRQIEADAHTGNAYAVRLLPTLRGLGRQAATLDDGVQAARSYLLDPESPAATDKAALLADKAALRTT